MSQNHYHVLGVSMTASAHEIKVAYKRLAVQYHPDKHGGNTRYEELFKAVAAAYHILGDPGRRAQYDYQLQAAARRAEAQLRQQQFRQQSQHVYGVPMPPPAPLRTRPPAGSRERHYRTIPRQRPKFTRRDLRFILLLIGGIILFVVAVRVTMYHVTAVSNYERGLEAYRRHQWSAAHSFFSEALHFKPDYTNALRRRAEIEQLAYQNPKAAVVDYRAALRHTTDARAQAGLLTRLGQSFRALHQSDSARAVLRQAVHLDSTQARAWLLLGEGQLFKQLRYAQANASFTAGLRHTRGAPTAVAARLLLYRGLARYKLGDLRAARADYWQALILAPHSGQTYFLLGRVAQKEGDTTEACEFFRRAVLMGYQYAAEQRRQTCP
ncbi:J domain-containing protein [Hymenobacter weizhouensis]|uniref:J domain-containing protein n=1 Tax=Hymenobacter sp. YIM 151500-1 TaxID=2987689 RepID=UPI00222646E5|nr:DnaJ domain-containing protein [Hymenobacter sp. YIM 151500-1]UYZ62185.1 DnaJ domain-containing protein [Hymenobacter sp. YIM 151500-1]